MAETAAPPETEQPQQTATIAPDATVQGAAQPANVETENKWPAPTIPEAPAPTQQAPKVLTPLKRHGLPGVLDEVGKWLAGTQGSEVYIDPDTGQRVVQHPPLTHAQQWAKIGAEAARGAAAGMAAGKGAGNQGKAALAGIEAQDKASQELSQTDEANAQADYSRQRQAKMDKANQQVQQLQVAQMGLQNARLGVETNEAQEKLQNEQLDRLEAHGGIRIPGEYTSDNIQTVTQAHPEFFTDHFKYNSIEPVAVSKNGKFDHVEFWAMPKDRATQPVADTDAKRGWPVYVPGDPAKNDAGHIEYSPIQPGEYAQGSYDAAMNAANTKLGTALKQISELKGDASKGLTKTPQETLAAASAAVDPAEKKRLTDLANQQQRSEEELRVAGRNVTSVINQGQPGAGGAATGPDDNYLQTIAPEYRSQVRSIADGNIPMPPRGKEGMAVRNMVMNYDPSYTEARYKAKQEFKTGPDADKMVQLATVLEHAENALNHSDAAGVSPLGERSFSQPVIQYNRDKNMFVSELGRLVKGGVIEKNEYDRLIGALDSMVPDKRRDALTEDLNLLGGKIQGLVQKYKTATGRDLNPHEFFNDQTQARLQRFGILPGAAGGAAPAAAATPTTPAAITIQPGESRIQLPNGNIGVVRNGQWADSGQKAQQ